jgi:hypothetical protein
MQVLADLILIRQRRWLIGVRRDRAGEQCGGQERPHNGCTRSRANDTAKSVNSLGDGCRRSAAHCTASAFARFPRGVLARRSAIAWAVDVHLLTSSPSARVAPPSSLRSALRRR